MDTPRNDASVMLVLHEGGRDQKSGWYSVVMSNGDTFKLYSSCFSLALGELNARQVVELYHLLLAGHTDGSLPCTVLPQAEDLRSDAQGEGRGYYAHQTVSPSMFMEAGDSHD